MGKQKTLLLLIVTAAVVLGACGRADSPAIPKGGVEMSIQLTSSAFQDGERIPVQYTCDGANISPSLTWAEIPPAARSLALIVSDPDAPSGDWTHWVLFDLEPRLPGLPEGTQIGISGKNNFGKQGWGGPCPPAGKAHRYIFRLYALDTMLGLKAGAARKDMEQAMQGHILAQGELMGMYGR